MPNDSKDPEKKKVAGDADIAAARKKALGNAPAKAKPAGEGARDRKDSPRGDKPAKSPKPAKAAKPEAAPEGAAARAEADAKAYHQKTHSCPRCDLELMPERYESASVEMCNACWGYWIGRPEFERILTSKDEHFSRDERKTAAHAQAHASDRKILTCPRCRKHMSKMAVEDEPGMVVFLVDYCRDHGLWLDTGEIKRAQILDEKSGSVRAALRSNFDRAAVEADED